MSTLKNPRERGKRGRDRRVMVVEVLNDGEWYRKTDASTDLLFQQISRWIEDVICEELTQGCQIS